MIGAARMIILVTRMIEQGVMKTSKQSYICLAKLAVLFFCLFLQQSSWHHPGLLGTEFVLLIILMVHKHSSWSHPRM